MEPRRTRRRLLKPQAVAWTEESPAPSTAIPAEIFAPAVTVAPPPARLQMPTPGSTEAAVALAPIEEEPEGEHTAPRPAFDLDDAPFNPPMAGLTLVPSLAPKAEVTEALEAFEASEEELSESWMDGVDALEVDRAVPAAAAESAKEDDSFPMDFEPGDSPSSLGVRLFKRLPPVSGLTRAESLLLGAVLTASPLVLAGGLFLGYSLARAVEVAPAVAVAAPAPITAAAVEPPVSEPIPVPVEAPPLDEPPAETPAAAPPAPKAIGRSAPKPTPSAVPKTAATQSDDPWGPWSGQPVAVPAPPPTAPTAPLPAETEDEKRGKKKKPK